MTSNDVRYLQIFLNSDSSTSMGNSGRETTYFGGMTKDAVGKFQVKYGLTTVSGAGYGQAGPVTRAKINSLLGM
jgi:peptidoglycan hydrolase-like protein with peptidoglycan-binding domain